jgi:hypothetical protein
MTSMVLGDWTVESLKPSVNAPLATKILGRFPTCSSNFEIGHGCC